MEEYAYYFFCWTGSWDVTITNGGESCHREIKGVNRKSILKLKIILLMYLRDTLAPYKEKSLNLEWIRIILINWYEVTNGPDGITGIPRPSFFGLPFTKFPDEGQSSFHTFFNFHYKFSILCPNLIFNSQNIYHLFV